MSDVRAELCYQDVTVEEDLKGEETISVPYRVWGIDFRRQRVALNYGPPYGALYENSGSVLRKKRVTRTATPNMLMLYCEYGKVESNLNKAIWTMEVGEETGHVNAAEPGMQEVVTPDEELEALIGDQIGLRSSSEGFEAEGADIQVPAISLTCQTWKRPTEATHKWQYQVSRYCQKTNTAVFRSFQPGEVRFVGVTVVEQTGELSECTFRFRCGRNRTVKRTCIDADGNDSAQEIEIKAMRDYYWEFSGQKHFEIEAGDDVMVKNRAGVLALARAQLYEEADFASGFGLESLKGLFGSY